MILAAGLGTRLRPLTDSMPKALVEVGGEPLLVHVARRLVSAGATRLIVNVHAFPEQIEAVIEAHAGFGVEVRVSHERGRPLETGGALLAAREHFRGEAPFFLHNADVWSDLSLEGLYAAHAASGALATLAVMGRETSRFLRFDGAGLCGWENRATGACEQVRAAVGEVRALPFCGVHVISPEFLGRITETGAFSIVRTYLRLSAEGAHIRPYSVDGATWVDIGRPEALARARALAGEAGPASA